MNNQGVCIFIVFSALLILTSCMTSDQLPNGFTKMERANTMSLEKKEMEKSNKKSIQYFIVAKLKSVNEQPQEYLEFKNKRFSDRSTCLNWASDNNQLLTRSLHEHLGDRKNGYFVDNIECLRLALLVTRYDKKAISI